MSGEGTLEQVRSGRARWCVVQSDCLDVMAGMPDGGFDAVVTDPPYGIGQSGARNERRAKIHRVKQRNGQRLPVVQRDYEPSDWDDRPLPAAWVEQIARVSRWQVVWGGNFYDLPPSGCWLVWDKLNGDTDFSDCELAWTNLPGAVRRFAFQWCGFQRGGVSGRAARERFPRLHPTQKPVPLMRWCLERLPRNVATVLDPCAGSGSTGVAALRAGLRVVLIDRDPRWADLCRERLRAEENNSDIQSARNGQAALFSVRAP